MSAFGFETSSRIIDSREARPLRLPFFAASCSLIAALTHAWVVRSHMSHWWAYGIFFAGLAIAQATYALLIVRNPGRRLVVAGLVGTAGVLALYAWSRTFGLPVGPHAGRVEAVRIPDLVAAAAEVVVIVTLLLMWASDMGEAGHRAGRTSGAAIVVGLVAAGMVGPVGPLHPRVPAITVAAGPETWAGPPAPPVPEQPSLIVEEPATDPAPVPEETPSCTVKVAAELPVPTPAGPGEARAVAYSSKSDVWIYDPADDTTESLTANDDACWARGPDFRSPTYVSLEMENGVYGIDLETGAVNELVSTKHGVMASAWSPDGKTLAYLTYASDDNGGPQLVLFRPAEGTKQIVRTFVPGEGRCGSEDDETSLSWAPDGHALIAVITHLQDAEKTMYVMDPSGDDLVAPRSGTSARWAPDSKRIYYRDFMGDRKWYTLNSETGDRGTLGGMKPGTYDLAVSPDGSRLAYHEGDDEVGVYIFDVATKKQRKVADDAVMAVWIGPRTLLVTDTKPCGEECFGSAWMSKETTSTVDVITEERNKAAPDATWDATAWFEEPEGPAPAPSPMSPSPQQTQTPTPMPLPTGGPTTEPSPMPTTEPTPDPSPSPTT